MHAFGSINILFEENETKENVRRKKNNCRNKKININQKLLLSESGRVFLLVSRFANNSPLIKKHRSFESDLNQRPMVIKKHRSYEKKNQFHCLKIKESVK